MPNGSCVVLQWCSIKVLVFASPGTFPVHGFQVYDGPVRMAS